MDSPSASVCDRVSVAGTTMSATSGSTRGADGHAPSSHRSFCRIWRRAWGDACRGIRREPWLCVRSQRYGRHEPSRGYSTHRHGLFPPGLEIVSRGIDGAPRFFLPRACRCGSCRSCGRTRRAHELLGNHRTVSTAPTAFFLSSWATFRGNVPLQLTAEGAVMTRQSVGQLCGRDSDDASADRTPRRAALFELPPGRAKAPTHDRETLACSPQHERVRCRAELQLRLRRGS